MTDVNETDPQTIIEVSTSADGETILGVDVKKVASDAKESFSSQDLITNIRDRAMRTVKLDLGYDEVNSEKLTSVESALAQMSALVEKGERNASGIDVFKDTIKKLKKQIAAAEEGDERTALELELTEAESEVAARAELLEALKPIRERLTEMEAAAEALRADVGKESLSVELRAIPYAIARGAARRARKTLGITEKGIPEDRREEFEEEQLIELAYDQVVRWRDNRSGTAGTKLELDVIRTIRDFMPLSQSAKFFNTVNDLQFKNAISESAIAQADF